jgi:hypothetical protein
VLLLQHLLRSLQMHMHWILMGYVPHGGAMCLMEGLCASWVHKQAFALAGDRSCNGAVFACCMLQAALDLYHNEL